MRILLGALTMLVLGAPAARACMPEDAYRAAEVAFDNDESFDLTRLTAPGIENVNYRIESQEKDPAFPSDQPVVVYQSHVNERVMVKVGFSPPGYDWRSVLIVLPEEMDPDTFDFPQAMEQELAWLAQIGALPDLDTGQISEITRDLAPGVRFFTRAMVSSHQGCFTLDYCVRCVGTPAYTELPPEPLVWQTARERARWGAIKELFR